MRYEDLNWMDVEAYLKKDDRLILVLGACEQHGYLSLLTDVKIPLALADAAGQQAGVLVAPALNFGISPYFNTYPGTISLKIQTYLLVAEDLVLTELCNELPGLRIEWYAWWTAPSVTAAAEKHGLKSYHAAWIEAFPFTRVGDLPEGIKEARSAKPVQNAVETREKFGDGVFGGPYQASETIMNEIFAAALADVLQLVQFSA
jgi:creatinine amidohydrolase